MKEIALMVALILVAAGGFALVHLSGKWAITHQEVLRNYSGR